MSEKLFLSGQLLWVDHFQFEFFDPCMVALRGTFGAPLVRESANILGNIDKKVRCVPEIYLEFY